MFYFSAYSSTFIRFCIVFAAFSSGVDFLGTCDTATAQDPASADQPKPVAEKIAYVPAIKLLPDSIAGLIRVPDVPEFCKAFETTNAGRFLDDPAMQPFIESQHERTKNYLESIDNKIGIRLEDIYHIGSGEAV